MSTEPRGFGARGTMTGRVTHVTPPFEEVEKRKIITVEVYPPVPWRHDDWQAYFDGDEPDDDGHMRHGSGATEQEAVADLLEQERETSVCIYYFDWPCADHPDGACPREECQHEDCPHKVKS